MRLKALACLLLLVGSEAFGVDSGDPKPSLALQEKSETKKYQAFGAAGFYSMTSRASYASGLEFNLGFRFARDEKTAFGPRLRQAFSSEEQVTLYTGFSMDLDYAITGRMTLDEGETTERGQRVFKYKERNVGGLKATVTVSQFFINTINVAVPFSGPGFGFRYDFPSEGPISITCGAGIDRLTNTEIMLIPFLAYAGLVHVL